MSQHPNCVCDDRDFWRDWMALKKPGDKTSSVHADNECSIWFETTAERVREIRDAGLPSDWEQRLLIGADDAAIAGIMLSVRR